jgi:hypothetical protein
MNHFKVKNTTGCTFLALSHLPGTTTRTTNTTNTTSDRAGPLQPAPSNPRPPNQAPYVPHWRWVRGR